MIRAADDELLILSFEGPDDLDLTDTWVRFLDEPVEISLSPELLGRELNGLGVPRDNRPPILSNLRRPVSGSAINPAARTYPREFIQTGISTIDGLNSLVRGQKLPIFSGSGLPHNRLAAQIVRQARLKDEDTSNYPEALREVATAKGDVPARKGSARDDTREDHPRVSAQLYALYARAQEIRNLASIIGADELSERDRRYLQFADAFDQHFVGQGESENRSIEATLNLAWELSRYTDCSKNNARRKNASMP